MAKKTVAAKKRNVKVGAEGQLHVHSSFNNIIVCLANSEGQVISWSSAGKMGFRGSKKNTPYAAQMAAQDCAKVRSLACECSYNITNIFTNCNCFTGVFKIFLNYFSPYLLYNKNALKAHA
mgnify:CR=1 FL=1